MATTKANHESKGFSAAAAAASSDDQEEDDGFSGDDGVDEEAVAAMAVTGDATGLIKG
jgi:hypothetical protein